ncbi:MAG: DUF7901 domain-containing protein [Planctomycetota bacterium]|jgi:hypothetical protein
MYRLECKGTVALERAFSVLSIAFWLALGVLPSVALAGWSPGDRYRMHYPQLPDLSANGLDVLAGARWHGDNSGWHEAFLADDFQADRACRVTDIHIWKSWNADLGPPWAPFSLVIYESPAGGSCPGTPISDTYVFESEAAGYATADESFYDPVMDEIMGPDTAVGLLSFSIPWEQAFVQQAGATYWLGLHMSVDANADGYWDATDLAMWQASYPGALGWKTSGETPFGAGAVWTQVGGSIEPFWFHEFDPHHVPTGSWHDLVCPGGHPLEGQAMELAFVIDGPLVGDFDGDDDLDADDIDLLCDHVGSPEVEYDLDGDGDVDEDDQLFLIENLIGTKRGDFNLDGIINATDLAIMKSNYGQCGVGYAGGNANCTTCVDGTDLAIFKANFGFMAPSGAVPEPATLGMLAVGAVARVRKRR